MSSWFDLVCRPDSGKFNAPSIQTLKRDGTKYIRVTWLDYSSIVRVRILPICRFEKLLLSARPAISLSKTCLAVVDFNFTPGFSHTGEYLYVFDLDSLRVCPYAGKHASVFGWLQEKTPNPHSMSLSVDLCPRTLLGKLIADARQIGTSFLVGIETEFILLKSTDPIEPVSPGYWCSSSATYSGSVASIVLEEIAETLGAGGVELEMYHAEGSAGHYEVVTGPMGPLEAADAFVYTREVIYNIANKHGLRATLAPRLPGNLYGSGAHTHVSMQSTAKGPKSPLAPTLESYEASFLQSVLENIPAICAFALPIASSYSRVADGISSGGTYVCWGTGNKEVPVRLCGAQGSHNIEIKCVDGTSNPYLVFAAILAAGIDGIRNRRRLEIGDCLGVAVDLGDEGRKELGIQDRMPLTIEQSRERLRENATLRQYFGEDLISKFLLVNETLQKSLSAETPEQEIQKIVSHY